MRLVHFRVQPHESHSLHLSKYSRISFECHLMLRVGHFFCCCCVLSVHSPKLTDRKLINEGFIIYILSKMFLIFKICPVYHSI